MPTFKEKLQFWIRNKNEVGMPGAKVSPLLSPPAGPNPVVNQTILVQTQPLGTSGINIYGGFYFEDYLNALHGQVAMDTYDKMRRGDADIRMVVNAVKNPIKGGTWEIEAAGDSPEFKKHQELVQHILFNDMDMPWKQHVHEALSFVEFGHVVFEVVHKAVLNHPRFGSYNGLKSLGFRSQRTVFSWDIDRDSGRIKSIKQLAVGDLQSNAEMDGEFLLVMSLDKEGANYEGISALRPCYGAWLRKQLYLKLMAIGIERTAVPTIIGEYPQGQQNSEQYNNLVSALQNLTSHENNFLTHPVGWKVTNLQNNFDAEKVRLAIEFENSEIVRAFLANFLLLGSGSGGGSYALSFDLSDFFLSGIQHYADLICEAHNHHTIPQLVKMNFGEQEAYPKLKCTGISDKAGKELSEIILNLAQSQSIIPDDSLEDHLRKRFNLSRRSDVGMRKVKPPSAQTPGDKEVEIENPGKIATNGQFSDVTLGSARAKGLEVKKIIQVHTQKLQAAMQAELTTIGKRFVSDVMTAYRSAPPAGKLTAANQVEPKGAGAYQRALVELHLGPLAALALRKARQEVPPKRAVKLSEFDDLPKKVQKKLLQQTKLVVDSQMGALKNAVYFQYGSSVENSLGSEELLEADLEGATTQFINGSAVQAGAGNLASLTVNESRNAFFFDEEVLEGVDSFTFVNPDPVSPICQDLAGSTFLADDPMAARFFPPLHHNCKSILVPNLKGQKNPEVTGLQPSSKGLEKYITLSEE